MKRTVTKIAYAAGVAALAFGIFALSCKASKGPASTAFAQTPSSSVSIDAVSTAQALQDTFRSITSQVLPAVVEVDVKETTKVKTASPFDFPFFFGRPRGQNDEENIRELEQSALGSGVIVKRTGNTIYVLTNNHVVGKATSIKIKLNDEREFEGTLVGKDERMDIALVSFESSDTSITVARLGDSDTMQQGDIVLALGSPLGYFASVTQGIVSATGRSGGQIGSISDFIQTDAAINQGNSGGPLVNIYGEVIGINTWIASQSGGSQGLGFSIPINNIKEAINQFISKGKISYGWVGVSLIEVTDDYKEALGISKTRQGALASQLFLDGPAYKGGLLPGDFIIALNGHDIKSVDQLVREIGGIPAGKTASITILRGNKEKELSVKIDERSEEVTANDSKLWPGFMPAPLTDDARKKLNIEKEKVEGVVVARVFEKSPAAALRLQNGDIICAVNDKKIAGLEEFYAALASAGKEVWFDVYSNGHVITTARYKIGK